MPRSVQILGTGQLLELRRRLRSAGGPRLQRNFARRIRRAAEPLRNDLQSTIRTMQIRSAGRRPNKHGVIPHGGPSPNTRPLRATVAEAVRISVRMGSNPGARVWVDRGSLPAGLRNMPWLMNDGRIRHPTFGNRHSSGWVNQYTPRGWWDKTLRKHESRMRSEVERILNDVSRDLG